MILPMIDVPVSLIGTFAVMAAMGFTLNNLTLFGLVLAIGIVVDDAIIVLENIERLMATGLDARAATIKAMEEITGPIIAITLVLCAVFIPCCFLGGITGQFFRQFAVTIAVSTIISAINAITMTPSRAVVIFKTEEVAHGQGHEMKPRSRAPLVDLLHPRGLSAPFWLSAPRSSPTVLQHAWRHRHRLARRHDQRHRAGPLAQGMAEDAVPLPSWMSYLTAAVYFIPGMLLGGLFGWFCIHPVNAGLGWFFRAFNRAFDKMTAIYGKTVGYILASLSVIVCIIYGGLLGLDRLAVHARPDRLHPPAGQGLPDPQRPASGRRLGRAHAKSHGAHRQDRPRRQGGTCQGRTRQRH